MFAVAFTAVISVLLILIFIIKEALPVLFNAEIKSEANFREFFLKTVWQPVSEPPKYSLLPLIVGTLKTSIVAVIIATPLGIASALFISEVAPSWMREMVKPAVELLAGIPSVVVGFFCLMQVASWLSHVFQIGWLESALTPHRLNALVGGIGISLAVVPIVFTLAEDALRGVPQSYRLASLALGATQWQTALRVVAPAAMPGLIAGTLLGFGRAWGETMIALMATGNAPLLDFNIFHSTRTMAATIGAEMAEVVWGSSHYHTLFFIGALLLIVSFIINIIAQNAVMRLQKRLAGG
ncbi:MAG TPA: phosphate ABC transporter permease subunit PstC [Armatimonadetes bacterium]|nr:phosphate ABC transporter permease subunit PstC [Armatimonadota bacterium]